MKKCLTVLLVIALVFALTACGGSSGGQSAGSGSSAAAPAASGQSSSSASAPASDAPLAREDEPLAREDEPAAGSSADSASTGPAVGSAESGTDLSGFDFSDPTASFPTDLILSQQDAASKQDLIDDGKEHGYTVDFGLDGSTTLTYDDGTVMVQNPDGTWNVVNDDGSLYQYGGGWPENEFTKQLPKPDMELMGANTEDGEFTVAFAGASVDDIRAYAEKVKAAGFDKDIEVQDQDVMGMTIYAFNASNADGYSVSVYYAAGTGGVTVSK